MEFKIDMREESVQKTSQHKDQRLTELWYWPAHEMPFPHEWIIRLSHSRELAWLRDIDAGGVMKVGDMQN